MPETQGYSIRLAELSDVPDLVFLGKIAYNFHYKSFMKWDSNKMMTVVKNAIESDDFIAYVLEKNNSNGKEVVGLFFGMVSEALFAEELQATEIVWYVQEEHRKTRLSWKMVEMFQTWAKKKGASYVMLTSVDRDLEKTKRFYSNRGFTLKELSFTKELV